MELLKGMGAAIGGVIGGGIGIWSNIHFHLCKGEASLKGVWEVVKCVGTIFGISTAVGVLVGFAVGTLLYYLLEILKIWK